MSEINQNEEFQYIKEQVKQAPLNRRKLMRRMIITALMAVIFGILACFTFLVLEPVFTNILHPKEEPTAVVIPADTADEILPEDMVLEEEPETMIQVIEHKSVVDADPMQIFASQYDELYRISQSIQPSIVTLSCMNQDVDWFDNEFTSKSTTNGIYVASNGIQVLILADASFLTEGENISVTFADGTAVQGELMQTDSNTGLCIVGVRIEDIPAKTFDKIKVVPLGNSKVSNLQGRPIIAVGRIYGVNDSVGYGILSAKGNYVNLVDQNYEVLTTSIYGSPDARGLILNTSGEILGIIDQSKSGLGDNTSVISAIGISEVKKDIERMSNGKARAFFGITGTDVTTLANESGGVPFGAFVTSVITGSPAMNAGIQNGDVIISADNKEITKFSELTEIIESKYPSTTIPVTVMRQGGEEYVEMDLELTLGDM